MQEKQEEEEEQQQFTAVGGSRQQQDARKCSRRLVRRHARTPAPHKGRPTRLCSPFCGSTLQTHLQH